MGSGLAARQQFAETLAALKARSGSSYEALARRTGISKSALHRYCVGGGLPTEFGMVERIGIACKASRTELAELYHRWNRADLERRRDEKTFVDELPLTREPENISTVVTNPARRTSGMLSAALVAIAVLLTAASAPNGSPQPAPNGQSAAGPTWSSAPRPVASTMFGVTMNSDTGAMPSFHVGAVRFWDSETRWANIAPRRGEYDWSVLDRLVNGANQAGFPALYVLGGTPGWAAPNGRRSVYPDGSRSAPADDLADWDGVVRDVVTRYRGRIEAYELWVLANDERFYSGSVETLVEMTRRARAIIASVDPRAVIVCPGMGRLWTPEGQQALQRFAELGGYEHCDVAGIKLHQRTASDPPETMHELIKVVDQAFHRAGVHLPQWSTGTTYEIPLQGSLDAKTALNYAVRFYLTGLYGRVDRMYFYNWGGIKIPLVLQAEGGPPSPAALAVEQLQRWLHHARITSCGHGHAASLPANVWQCRFIVSERGGDERVAVIRWTDRGSVTMSAEAGTSGVRRLDGSATALEPGAPLQITEEPILIDLVRSRR